MPDFDNKQEGKFFPQELRVLEFMRSTRLFFQEVVGIEDPTILSLGSSGDLLSALPWPLAVFMDMAQLNGFKGYKPRKEFYHQYIGIGHDNPAFHIMNNLQAVGGEVVTRSEPCQHPSGAIMTEMDLSAGKYPLQKLYYYQYDIRPREGFPFPELLRNEANLVVFVKAGMHLLDDIAAARMIPDQLTPRGIIYDTDLSGGNPELTQLLRDAGYNHKYEKTPYPGWAYTEYMNIAWR